MTDQAPRTSRNPDEERTQPLALTRDWRTARTDLDVLLIVHSLTAAARIADVLPALDDPRVQRHCVRTTGVFEAGIDDFVHHHGLHELTWEQARSGRFDLVVTASLGDELHEITSPILRLPHGNGYNKYWNQEPGTRNQEPGTRNQEPGRGRSGSPTPPSATVDTSFPPRSRSPTTNSAPACAKAHPQPSPTRSSPATPATTASSPANPTGSATATPSASAPTKNSSP
ncbi:hypothetical protein [Nocardiopsis salina]|uniref:hypothetical protein n=1 Tax=Nocardiopsis salina TaxID=245836 RepID=UPI00034560B6|nr:hypothetical protein [Nocardiopsis salina]